MKTVEEYTIDTFAHTLKTLRRQNGCSQTVLADLLNVTLTTIRAWEQGKRMPKMPKETLQIAQYELQQWSDWKKYNKPPRFRTVRHPSRELIEFFKNMRNTAALTIEELADRMGENEWDLLALEKGKKEPKDKERFIRKLRSLVKEEIKQNREKQKS